jgi:transposase
MMRGRRDGQLTLYSCVRLEEMVPHDHILWRLDRAIDFSFIDRLTEPLYSHTGRPSVDPQVLVRMMIIGYLFGITSERRLCQELHLNLAYRWFCGLSLEDKVPDHSTFSKNRHGRFANTTLFRDLFYEVVRQAAKHGLISGQHFSVDATTVQAAASLESLEPIVVSLSPEQYVEQLDQPPPPKQPATADDSADRPSPPPPLSNDTHRSRTDPDARLLARPFQKTQLAYSANVLMDNRHRVIVDVEVTEPNLHEEGQVAGVLLERSQLRLGVAAQTVAGDKAYGYGAAVRCLWEAGVAPHVPSPLKGQWNAEGIFGKEQFRYDRERDELICPAGRRLHKRTEHTRNRQSEYAARVKDCRACPLKAQCTRTRYRVAHRHWDQDYLNRAEALRQSAAYRISQRCRKKIEHLFAEAKEQMGLRRARRHGWHNVTEQCLLTALVQNLKRIVAMVGPLPKTAASAAAAVSLALNRLIEVHRSLLRLMQRLLAAKSAASIVFGRN